MQLVKKTVFLLLFSLWVVCGSYAQQGGAGPIDLILLLDTSSSMSGSYREVNDYITGPFLREFLRIGDTFHLISFSDKPKVEIARRIEGQGEVETIIGRMLLMYPLEPWSDIPGALAYAEKYTDTLPPSRPKKIVLISDGDVSPAPESGSTALDQAGLQILINDTKTRLGRQGISLDHVTVPLAELPVSGRTPVSVRVAQEASPAQAAAPVQSAPVTPSAPPPVPVTQAPPQSDPVTPAQTTRPAADSAQPTAPVAEPSAPMTQTPPVQPEKTTQPATPLTPPPNPVATPSENLPIIGLAILVLALIGGGIFFITRRRKDSSKRVVAGEQQVNKDAASPQEIPGTPSLLAHAEKIQATPSAKTVPPVPAPILKAPQVQTTKTQSPQPQSTASWKAPRTQISPWVPPSKQDSKFQYPLRQLPKPLPVTRLRSSFEDQKGQDVPTDGRPLMLKLFVKDQNTFIGKRNTHLVKQGFKFTIGGGKSDFLIFLVPLPPSIAELHYEENHCILIPRKGRYFPDIGDEPVKDCIGKTIRIISDKNYELYMRIEWYEDPLIKLNTLLRSVSVPG